jgi:hypothetical protein
MFGVRCFPVALPHFCSSHSQIRKTFHPARPDTRVGVHEPVPLPITFQLPPPPGRAICRPRRVLWAAVPETAVHEDGKPLMNLILFSNPVELRASPVDFIQAPNQIQRLRPTCLNEGIQQLQQLLNGSFFLHLVPVISKD